MNAQVNVRRTRKLILTVYILSLLLLNAGARPAAAQQNQEKKYVPVVDYDPTRNAAEDVREAIAEAQRAKKNILLEVGGKWCIWCRIMDEFFKKNPDLVRLRDQNYVTLKINYSPENENKEVLSRYAEVPAYPHLFVLDSNGKLLQSQYTGDLEEGKSYNREKFTAFLNKWAPPR
jgi:thiol:disulfide interchange protein